VSDFDLPLTTHAQQLAERSSTTSDAAFVGGRAREAGRTTLVLFSLPTAHRPALTLLWLLVGSCVGRPSQGGWVPEEEEEEEEAGGRRKSKAEHLAGLAVVTEKECSQPLRLGAVLPLSLHRAAAPCWALACWLARPTS